MTSSERPSSRERLLSATVELLETKGPAASGTKEILTLAEAPRGSFYFHFPGGKDELVAAAVAQAAATTHEAIAAALGDDAVALPERIEQLVRGIGTALVEDEFRLGCAVGATTLEVAATSPPLRAATEIAFASWTDALTAAFVAEGIAPGLAAELADGVVAGMEGATMLARSRRDPAPLEHMAAMLRNAVAAAIPPAAEG